MKQFTRILCLFLAAVLLAGCSSLGMSRESKAEAEKLTAILDEFAENIRGKSSAGALEYAQLAGELALWAASTTLTREEAQDVIAKWLKKQGPEIRAAFEEKMASLGSSVSQMIDDSISGLMKEAKKEIPKFDSIGDVISSILEFGGLD